MAAHIFIQREQLNRLLLSISSSLGPHIVDRMWWASATNNESLAPPNQVTVAALILLLWGKGRPVEEGGEFWKVSKAMGLLRDTDTNTQIDMHFNCMYITGRDSSRIPSRDTYASRSIEICIMLERCICIFEWHAAVAATQFRIFVKSNLPHLSVHMHIWRTPWSCQIAATSFRCTYTWKGFVGRSLMCIFHIVDR